MSRVGKKIIDIPKDVTLTLTNQKIIVKGKNGVLERNLEDIIELIFENQQLKIIRKDDSKKSREYHGLIRALIQNMVTGVSSNFSKTLIAEGVGYKFQVEKQKLTLNLIGKISGIAQVATNNVKF